MNPRIRELAEQALKHPDTDNDGLTVFDNDELEKFAELIVRECINEMETSKRCDPYTGEVFISEYNKAVDDQVSMLKEHFEISRMY